jgi:hypothetical protein
MVLSSLVATMARVPTRLIVASMAASLPWLACSGGSSGTAHDGATADAADSPADGADGPSGPYDPNGPYAACNDPATQTSTLRGSGFEAWEGIAILGCLNPSVPDVAGAVCDDGDVTNGAFTLMASVCTGSHWDLHIFDGSRGLDCFTTRPPVDRVFTITPADCTCASPNAVPSAGCAGVMDGGADGDAGQDAVQGTSGDAPGGTSDDASTD